MIMFEKMVECAFGRPRSVSNSESSAPIDIIVSVPKSLYMVHDIATWYMTLMATKADGAIDRLVRLLVRSPRPEQAGADWLRRNRLLPHEQHELELRLQIPPPRAEWLDPLAAPGPTVSVASMALPAGAVLAIEALQVTGRLFVGTGTTPSFGPRTSVNVSVATAGTASTAGTAGVAPPTIFEQLADDLNASAALLGPALPSMPWRSDSIVASTSTAGEGGAAVSVPAPGHVPDRGLGNPAFNTNTGGPPLQSLLPAGRRRLGQEHAASPQQRNSKRPRTRAALPPADEAGGVQHGAAAPTNSGTANTGPAALPTTTSTGAATAPPAAGDEPDVGGGGGDADVNAVMDWLTGPARKTDSVMPPDLNWMSAASLSKIDFFCLALRAAELSEEQLVRVCAALSAEVVSMSYANSVVVMSALVAPVLGGLTSTASRALDKALGALGKRYPAAFFDHVILPLAAGSSLSAPQRLAIVKLMAECFGNDAAHENLVRLAEGIEVAGLSQAMDASATEPWNEEKISLMTLLFKKSDVILDPALLARFCAALLDQSEVNKGSLKFAQILQAVMTKCGSRLVPSLADVQTAVARNTTFMKKSLLSALKKIEKTG